MRWGNIAAINVLQLDANETASHQSDMSLLFAASGDMRNLVKTVVDLPSSYLKPDEAVLNDKEFDLVVRNAVMLLIALTTDDPKQACTTISTSGTRPS